MTTKDEKSVVKEDLENQNVSEKHEDTNSSEEDKVAYNTYKKLLNEKKQQQQKLEELLSWRKEIELQKEEEEEKKLKEQQKWQEIADKKEKELKKLQEQMSFEKKKQQNKIKEEAFKDALGANLKKAYMLHVDLDAIDLSEDGQIDEYTLENVVDKFKEEFPELLPKKEEKKEERQVMLPNKRPKGVKPQNFSLQELKGLSTKELQELLAEHVKK